MLFLPIDVSADFVQLLLAERHRTVSFLPRKLEFWLDLPIYAKGRCTFEWADKFADRDGRRKPRQKVNVIRHGVVADRVSSSFCCLLVQYREKLGAPRSMNVRFSGMRGPNDVIKELVINVAHFVVTHSWRTRRP